MGKLLLISDAHETGTSGSAAEFREMLAAVSSSDYDVAFLGDIMDLWIGIPRFEDDLQRDFLEWCRREKENRRILYVEGNHEFYLARSYGDVFTQVTEGEIIFEDVLMGHGHGILESPIGINRLLMSFCKTLLGKLILTLMPFGIAFTRLVKRLWGSNGRIIYRELPLKRIGRWAAGHLSGKSAKLLVLGHFHYKAELAVPDGRRCIILPAWKNRQEVSLLDTETLVMETGCWREILGSGVQRES